MFANRKAANPGSATCPSSIPTPRPGWRWSGSPCVCRWPGRWPALLLGRGRTSRPTCAFWCPSATQEVANSTSEVRKVQFFAFLTLVATCSHIKAMGLFTQPLTIWAPRPTVTPSEVSSQTRPPIRSLASSTTTWNRWAAHFNCCDFDWAKSGSRWGRHLPACQNSAVAVQQPTQTLQHQWRWLSSGRVTKLCFGDV